MYNVLSVSMKEPPKSGYLRLPGGSSTAFSPTPYIRDAPNTNSGTGRAAPEPKHVNASTGTGAIPLPPDLGIPSAGLRYIGDMLVRTTDPEAQPDDEVDEHGNVIRRCADGSRALNASQIAAATRRLAAEQRQLDRKTNAHCHVQLKLSLARSGDKPKFAFGNDPRHINIPEARPWLLIHRTHDMQGCDVTVFCRKCGGNSSGSKTATLQLSCDPSIGQPEGKTNVTSITPPLGVTS